MTMTPEKKAKLLLADQSMETLITSIDKLLGITNGKSGNLSADEQLAIAQAVGWLMDELEQRDPKAFAAWIESAEDSPRSFFKI